jgi:hypothetical protein
MTVTKSDFDPTCLGQYDDPPETLHFQWEGKRCDNFVYRYVLVDKIRPNKLDSRTKKTEEEKDKSHKEIAAGYLPPLVLTEEVKPGLMDKIKKVLF